MKLRKIFGLVMYNLIGKHLPVSYKIKIGQTAFRRFCAKLILDKCGKNVNIEKGAKFSHKCRIGNFSGIGVNCNVGICYIGDYVMMGPDVVIYNQNHKYDRLDLPMQLQGYKTYNPVEIGNDVWIGGRVTILPGVKIGEGSIIGASTVVTKDVPPYSVFCGNPGKVIKYRNR